MDQEEVRTLEARRQLIWAAKQQGWLEAAEYLEEHGRGNAAQVLRIKLKEKFLDPAPR